MRRGQNDGKCYTSKYRFSLRYLLKTRLFCLGKEVLLSGMPSKRGFMELRDVTDKFCKDYIYKESAERDCKAYQEYMNDQAMKESMEVLNNSAGTERSEDE